MEMLGGRKLFSEERKGIGGWLLFVCVYLAIVHPLLMILGLPVQFPESEGANNPEIFVILSFCVIFVLNIFMILFSLVSGIILWRRNKIGIVLAKIFFISYFLLTVLDTVVVLFLNLDQFGAGERVLMESVIRKSLYGILVPVLLFVYLLKSKRVKNTFFTLNENKNPL